MDWQVTFNIIIFYSCVYIVGKYFVNLFDLNVFMALPVGLSLIVLLLNILLIPFNLSIYNARIILFIIVIILLISLTIQNRILFNYEHAILVFSALVITLIPALVGGMQFYSFRGNWWDHFNYISSVLTLRNHDVEFVRNIDLNEAYIDPIISYGLTGITIRPSVTFLVAQR